MDDVWKQALAAREQGDLANAFALCSAVLDRYPTHLGALQLMGALALQMEQAEEALVFFGHALRLRTDDPVLWSNRGSALHALGRHGEALKDYDQALALQPAFAEAWYNRANTLKAMGRLEEACDHFERSALIADADPRVHYNWGNTLHELGRYRQAVERFDRAVELRPQDGEARKNRSFAKLMLADFESGWADYDWRWTTEPLNRAWVERSCPQWTGQQDLHGRSILLHAEQGLGDTLQFCRLAPLVKARGAAVVVLEVQRPLGPLLRGLPGVDLLVAAGTPLPPHDLHIPLMSLPRALGLFTESSIPAPVPYLHADPDRQQRWADRLSPRAFNIGICWEGSAKGKEVGKGIPLKTFRPLAGLPGVQLVSLQKSPKDGSAAQTPADLPLQDFGDELDRDAPFVDTAALMTVLDLVVTTDTSVAHLAGALGVPVWVALPHIADWRWMAHRTDSPWYPTMRLFRQPQPGAWEGCFAEITRALRDQMSM